MAISLPVPTSLSRPRFAPVVSRHANLFVALCLLVTVTLSGSGSAPVRLVALGDSITFGWPIPQTGWLADLVRSERGRVEIDNAGIPGDRTDQMLARLDSTVLALRPRAVFLMGGTNDITQDRSVVTAVANLRTIVDRLKAEGIGVVLLTVAPRSEPRYVQRTVALNRAITDLGSQERVPIVDVFGRLAGPQGRYRPGLTIDGVHPSPAGYRLIADAARGQVRFWAPS